MRISLAFLVASVSRAATGARPAVFIRFGEIGLIDVSGRIVWSVH